MKMRTIENLDVRGKYVLLRDDFNVQIVDGKITEFRFEEIDGDWYLATVSYGTATVGALPSLD